jgi:hypothetical protein
VRPIQRGRWPTGRGLTVGHSVIRLPEVKNPLEFLAQPLNKTFERIDRYIDWAEARNVYSDRPYLWNERATLSVFAGGVWLADESNLVLEEYCYEKRGSHARHDIWFLAGGRACYGEAKQSGRMWPCACRFAQKQANAILRIVGEEADTAWHNAQHFDFKVDHALGIAFVVPYVGWNDRCRGSECMRRHFAEMDSALRQFAGNEKRFSVCGRYFREDLLKDEAFYEAPKVFLGKRTYPSLEILICTSRHDRTAYNADHGKSGNGGCP